MRLGGEEPVAPERSILQPARRKESATERFGPVLITT